MNFNQKTYVFRFKNICFFYLDSENNIVQYGLNRFKRKDFTNKIRHGERYLQFYIKFAII